MEIPYEKIQKDTLHKMIREFVLREGTDYSHQEHSIEDKISRVAQQLRERTAIIVYDPKEETFNIVLKTEFSGQDAHGKR